MAENRSLQLALDLSFNSPIALRSLLARYLLEDEPYFLSTGTKLMRALQSVLRKEPDAVENLQLILELMTREDFLAKRASNAS